MLKPVPVHCNLFGPKETGLRIFQHYPLLSLSFVFFATNGKVTVIRFLSRRGLFRNFFHPARKKLGMVDKF